MSDASASDFEQIAKSARVQASVLQKVFADLSKKSQTVMETVGGSVTGNDKKMVQLLDRASSRAARAVTELENAAKAAGEAAARIRAEQAEQRAQAQRSRR